MSKRKSASCQAPQLIPGESPREVMPSINVEKAMPGGPTTPTLFGAPDAQVKITKAQRTTTKGGKVKKRDKSNAIESSCISACGCACAADAD